MQTRLVILLFLVTSTIGGQHERRLLKHLFVKQQHDPLERPTENDSESVSVHLAFSFINLIDFVRINITTSTNTIDLSSYVINNKWKLIDSYMTLNEVKYECCPQAYLSVVLTIKIRRVLDDFPININGTENEDK
ncbi:unnamed protein product [Rotaria socialis]|uniref:Uncharacterized protein n=1 Tax=Rotaria socialis TaxID=392032 RepID=A0A821K5K7_9BILA|nr:unnamed protein product [Rotaria socialis]